jgi:hypothetical protein
MGLQSRPVACSIRWELGKCHTVQQRDCSEGSEYLHFVSLAVPWQRYTFTLDYNVMYNQIWSNTAVILCFNEPRALNEDLCHLRSSTNITRTKNHTGQTCRHEKCVQKCNQETWREDTYIKSTSMKEANITTDLTEVVWVVIQYIHKVSVRRHYFKRSHLLEVPGQTHCILSRKWLICLRYVGNWTSCSESLGLWVLSVVRNSL